MPRVAESLAIDYGPERPQRGPFALARRDIRMFIQSINPKLLVRVVKTELRMEEIGFVSYGWALVITNPEDTGDPIVVDHVLAVYKGGLESYVKMLCKNRRWVKKPEGRSS